MWGGLFFGHKGYIEVIYTGEKQKKINGVVGSMMEGLGVYLKMSRVLKKGKKFHIF